MFFSSLHFWNFLKKFVLLFFFVCLSNVFFFYIFISFALASTLCRLSAAGYKNLLIIATTTASFHATCNTLRFGKNVRSKIVLGIF